MMHQTAMIDISEVRRIVKRVVREEPTPMDVVQAARDTVQTMCEEAAQYGLTPADIVKGVLHPVFEAYEKKRVCNCPTCRARRNDSAEEQPLWARVQVTW